MFDAARNKILNSIFVIQCPTPTSSLLTFDETFLEAKLFSHGGNYATEGQS